jgi:predicted nucleic acid-binding protein
VLDRLAPPPKAVLDTNLLVRALIGGSSIELLAALRDGFYRLVTSEALLAELADVVVQGVYTDVNLVPRDAKDNPVVACALEGEAEYIVTDDRRDLLVLKAVRVAGHRVVQIVGLRPFLRQILQYPPSKLLLPTKRFRRSG